MKIKYTNTVPACRKCVTMVLLAIVNTHLLSLVVAWLLLEQFWRLRWFLESLFLTAASRVFCRGPAGGCLLGWCSGWALRPQRTWGVWRSAQLPGERFMAMSTGNQELSLREAASRSPRLHGSSPRAGIVLPTEGPWTSCCWELPSVCFIGKEAIAEKSKVILTKFQIWMLRRYYCAEAQAPSTLLRPCWSLESQWVNGCLDLSGMFIGSFLSWRLKFGWDLKLLKRC